MAVRIEITRQAFRLDIDLGEKSEEVDDENITAITNGTLSFMESRACHDEDIPDGVELAGQLHNAAHTMKRNDVGWKVGKDYARWGDELFKDPGKREELLSILRPLIDGVVTRGGQLLKEALKAILCDRFGIVSEIKIERVASVFMLCWNLFKTAVITYSMTKAFQVLGKILGCVILFLQESQFFKKLREKGGWKHMHQLVTTYHPRLNTSIKYTLVAGTAAVVGGLAVYFYLKWTS